MSDDEPLGTEAYATFLKDELEAQEKRKASFEQRGLAVITTAGTLVTVLFGLAAFSTKESSTFKLPAASRDWLGGSLVFFAFAALLALLTNWPMKYEAVDVAALKERLKSQPPRSADSAVRDIALTRIKSLASAKSKNTLKGRFLIGAMASEVIAAICVAIAIAHLL